MDALSFLKLLWRPTPIPTNATDMQRSFAETDDDDDSFFELDVSLSDFDNVALKFHKANSTPSSPVSILVSSPSCRGPMFGKSRDTGRHKAGDGNRAKKTVGLFSVRLKVKEVTTDGGDGSPKRNSSDFKDGFMKYLKPFRVSYGHGSDDMWFATCMFSPSSSPVTPPKKGKPKLGFRVGYNNLGKSKVANGGGSTDDCMAEQRECVSWCHPPLQEILLPLEMIFISFIM